MRMTHRCESTCKVPATLRSLLSKSELKTLLANHSTGTRRLSQIPEQEICIQHLCQPIDIHAMSGKPRAMDRWTLPGYLSHSLPSACREIERLAKMGITSICVKPHKLGQKRPSAILDQHCAVIRSLKKEFGAKITLIADPINTALNDRNIWGIPKQSRPDIIDYEKTLEFIVNLAGNYGDSHADAILAIGRIDNEVQVIKKTLTKHQSPTKIISCSTNSETLLAYIASARQNPNPQATGQKILCGNINEMVLRAMIDVVEGSDRILQKPTESFHVLLAVASASANEQHLDTFLNSNKVACLLNSQPRWKCAATSIRSKMATVNYSLPLGSYTVSGTYAHFKVIEQRYGTAIALRMYEEFVKNAFSSGLGKNTLLIDRLSSWYVENGGRITCKLS